MQRLSDICHHVDVQILDNEVSAAFKKTIVEDWCATYKLVPPNVHRRNVSERAIRTFKVNLFCNPIWGRSQLPQVYVGQTLSTDRTNNQPSLESHTQPKHVHMGILQWCF